MSLTHDKASEEILETSTKILISKASTLIVIYKSIRELSKRGLLRSRD